MVDFALAAYFFVGVIKRKSLSTFHVLQFPGRSQRTGQEGTPRWEKKSVVDPPLTADFILTQEVFPSASVGPLWE